MTKDRERMPSERPHKGTVIDAVLREVGVGCTYDQVQAALRREGIEGGCHQVTFEAHRRKVFPDWNFRWNKPKEGTVVKTHEANGRVNDGLPDLPRVVSRETIPPPAPNELDWLSKFVRFALAVEQVGGIEAAERMLRALKEMPRGE